MNNNAQIAGISFNSVKPRDIRIAPQASKPTNRKKSNHSAWGAFQAGMQFLQQYAGKSPGNSETIAKANLQLLHRSLLKDSSYIRSIKDARMRIAGNSLPNSYCIFSDTGFRADLLSLNPGTTILLKSHQNTCSMYLSITGKPSIQAQKDEFPVAKHWWDRYRKEGCGKPLKNGDAIIASSRCKAQQVLTAEKKECLLLRVQLSNGCD